MDSPQTQEIPEIAFYYPGPMWHAGDWVKNLILFFDGIALLVPEYMKERPLMLDPAIVSGLDEQGLLHILEPETLIDKNAAEQLAAALTEIIVSGVLDHLANDKSSFQELSYSRLGGMGDVQLANMLLEELKARGLARNSEDGVSIPMHYRVRSLILVLLAQILRPYGAKMGMELSPATDQPSVVGALRELLALPATSTAHVVNFDLMTVGVDLSSVPLDEVLSFRCDHLKEHKAYSRNVRQFVREISVLPEADRDHAYADRREELAELALHLHNVSKSAWKKPAVFGLSLSGAAWTLASHNPIGAVISAVAAIVGSTVGKPNEADAYSYLFRAQNTYP